MPKKTRKPPSDRQRKGYTQALVTLTDAATRQRHDSLVTELVSDALRAAIEKRRPDINIDLPQG